MNRVFDNFTINEVFAKALDIKEEPYRHQRETARYLLDGKSVVLRAPCGSGKTEACFVSFLLGRNYTLPNRLVYSLPTRALVEDVSERVKKGIGRIGLPPIVSSQHGANSEDPLFNSEVVIATIDQTIGAYCCTPLSLPVSQGNIPAGAVISSFLCFDEAHVYDHLLGLQSTLVLVERAAELGLPFLVMSATLPNSFIKWFEERFGETIAIVKGNDEDVPKRQKRNVTLQWVGKLLEREDILGCADSWNRIMVVCNTVNHAQALFNSVKQDLKNHSFNVFLLHSRFLDGDKEKIENAMKSSLEDLSKKTCLITTQVCEVGLDISCDLLLTELSPPDSLIQRMGRCAREGGNGAVRVFEVEYCLPYKKGDIDNTRKYLSEKLDGKRIGWNEELEFVNALLDQDFRQIMNDKNRRLSILKRLGDSAFDGNRKGIEDCIRDVLTTNITICEKPHELTAVDLLGMPWIDIDVRVLNHQIGKMGGSIWLVKFERDEEGKLTKQLFSSKEASPYQYYVVSSNYSAYNTELGLMFGSGLTGIKWMPSKGKSLSEEAWVYSDESWIEHVNACLRMFDYFKLQESSSFELLQRLLGLTPVQTSGVVELCLVLHDLGKLNIEWQRSFGITEKSLSPPIAHAPYEKKRKRLPPHATISAYAAYPLLEQLLKNAKGKYRKIYALQMAIGHHHHTRAQQGCEYRLGWRNIYDSKIMDVATRFDLDLDISSIIDQDHDANLEQSFPGIEKTDEYAIYCIVSRLIRLCDRAATKSRENSKNQIA